MCRDQHRGFDDLSVQELRDERADLRHTEARLSYERRLVQGRIDLLRAELARRDDEAGAGALADRLAVVLTDRENRDVATTAVPALATAVPDGSEGHFDQAPVDLAALDLGELGELAATLESQERELSRQRRDVFGALDALAAELSDRYRRDDVPVAQLLDG